jgi:hydrogenase-4 membrane subunit HyfE
VIEKITAILSEDTKKAQNDEKVTSRFTREVLAYIELLSCTVTNAEPKLAGMLTQASLQTQEMQEHTNTVGIEPWLLSCLVDIMTFRHWREEQVRRSSLSIAEMVKKAMSIEQSLENGRSRGEKTQKEKQPVPESWVFTNIFACGASILLHATISHARPHVLEIQTGVTDLIAALQLLPRPEMLKRLSWPICM